MNFPQGALAYNLAIVGVIWLGALLSLASRQHHQFLRTVVSFSAGVFLGVAFLHMIPSAIQLAGETAGAFVLFGFVFFFLMERFVMTHPCEERTCNYHHIGLAAFLGLSLHSLMNGVALGSSLLVPGLGIDVFLATLIHKAPESFSLTCLFVLAKKRTAQLIPYVVAFSLMVPLGSAIGLAGLSGHGSKVIGCAVAISAGTFLQLATNDLLPETHMAGPNRFKALGGFVLGLALTAVTKYME